MIAMVGETNRAPFDLPEAEGELVGGFHTEYSSLKFALFFLAEYINMVTVSALATTLFLGGWRAPWPLSAINDGMLNEGYWPFLWFIAKVMIFIFFFIWLRGTLPRLRYDQFMKFGWKVLIPVSLVWIVLVAAIRADQPRRRHRPHATCIGAFAVLARAAACCSTSSARSRAGRPGRRPTRTRVRRLRRRLPRPADELGARQTTRCSDSPGRRELMPTLKEQFWDPVAGFGVTFRTMFRRSSPSSTRSRRSRPRPGSTAGTSSTAGPTGWRSASAASCAPGPARPTRSTSRAPPTPTDERFSPGERYGRVYQINYLRCILCGLCIEACPTRALTMTNEYELADDNRADLIYEKSDLLAPLLPGMEQPPHADAARRRRGRLLPRHVLAGPSAATRRHDRGGGALMIAFWVLAPIMVSPRSASCSPARPCTPRCCWRS